MARHNIGRWRVKENGGPRFGARPALLSSRGLGFYHLKPTPADPPHSESVPTETAAPMNHLSAGRASYLKANPPWLSKTPPPAVSDCSPVARVGDTAVWAMAIAIPL